MEALSIAAFNRNPGQCSSFRWSVWSEITKNKGTIFFLQNTYAVLTNVVGCNTV
jgi:hypothetical protein